MPSVGASFDDDLEPLVPEGMDQSDGPPVRSRWRRSVMLIVGAALLAGAGTIALSGRPAPPTRLCPAIGSMLHGPGTEGGPMASQLVTDRHRAEAVLHSYGAAIRNRYPFVTSMRVGAGWGRGWTDIGTAVVLAPVADYAIVAKVRDRSQCPSAQAFTGIEGVPIFFASS